MSIRAAWINLDTGIVENIILVTDIDLSKPEIKKIPSEINSDNIEFFLPVSIDTTKWSDNLGFTDLNGQPLTFFSNESIIEKPLRLT